MKEFIILIVIFVLFTTGSYFFYKITVDLRQKWFIFSIVVYLIAIDLLIEFANQLSIYLRIHKIYLEFGHASSDLLILWIFCYLIGAIVICTVGFKRGKQINKN